MRAHISVVSPEIHTRFQTKMVKNHTLWSRTHTYMAYVSK